jgi:muramoyltetrapeptide carboxypeptidase LdcA involved in peptidoglycan recycling
MEYAKQILSPSSVKPGDTLGVFTPSSPGYAYNEGLFENGIQTLERLGFKVKLGALTAQRGSQGYRSGSPQERAQEFMDLITDPEVKGLISTIGGNNSSSMIPHLDFEKIRISRKLICGFSDVTSLHLAILKYAGLRTVYGPSIMCWFGEWPHGIQESNDWFLQAAMNPVSGLQKLSLPKKWSNHKRDWSNDDWKNLPRQWQENTGWKVLNPGTAQAPIVVCNFNTLMSSAGTSYWPDLEGKILLLEDMEAPFARTERHLRQLQLMGVFEKITGLIIGKPEFHNPSEAPFSYDDLFMEVIGKRNYPIISNFDCSHTVPMISIMQLSQVKIEAQDQMNSPSVWLDRS